MNQRTDPPSYPLLEQLSSVKELQGYSIAKLEQLAQSCRARMIEVTSKNGGHLASSLGTVELTLALAKVFDLSKDKLIWDVGHQAYTYKLITGRHAQFDQLGKKEGIGKFLKRSESPLDHFGAGHASTSISAGLGIAVGNRLQKKGDKTIVVIGDGSLTGGMAYEAMNHAGHLSEDLIVILNDNEMSIDPVVGALSKTIINISASKSFNLFRGEISRLSKESILPRPLLNGLKRVNESFMAFFTQGVWFENLNFRYFGQVDGHKFKDLISLFKHTKNIPGPLLLHVSTQKGKGYSFAEEDALNYHGVSAFDPSTGQAHAKSAKGKSYTAIWEECFTEIMKKDEQVVALSAAMLGNTGLADLEKEYPTRIFDVGIAEEHGVTFSAGLATEGLKPFVVIYSTFLQRAMDQIVHDVALQNLPVRFILDRAGFVGPDGATHHGVLDLTYLRMIPNLVILAPKDGDEFKAMIHFVHHYDQGPIALRFPRANCEKQNMNTAPIQLGRGELLAPGKDVCLIALGTLVEGALNLKAQLAEKGIEASVINARFAKPLDEKLILSQARNAPALITLEEGSEIGGFGSAILELLAKQGLMKPVLRLAIPDRFFEHASRDEQLEAAGLSEKQMRRRIEDFLQQLN